MANISFSWWTEQPAGAFREDCSSFGESGERLTVLKVFLLNEGVMNGAFMAWLEHQLTVK